MNVIPLRVLNDVLPQPSIPIRGQRLWRGKEIVGHAFVAFTEQINVPARLWANGTRRNPMDTQWRVEEQHERVGRVRNHFNVFNFAWIYPARFRFRVLPFFEAKELKIAAG